MADLRERFYQTFEAVTESGCWIWTGYSAGRGYGQIKSDLKRLYAHRLSYELHVGTIPSGLCVCHRCDVTACVNPEHLFLGTYADNNQDKKIKGRGNHGERNGRAVLTPSQVQEIRDSKDSTANLARRFNVAYSTVRAVRFHERWKHIQ